MHRDAVQGAFAPEHITLTILVGQPQLREIQIEMAALGWQIHRLERTAAFLRDDLEALHQTDVIALFRVGAGAAPAARSRRRLSSFRKPMPCVSSTCNAASMICSTWSALSTSIGA